MIQNCLDLLILSQPSLDLHWKITSFFITYISILVTHNKNNGNIWVHTCQNMEVTAKLVIFQCKSRLG